MGLLKIHHFSLSVNDIEKGIFFYKNAFGYKLTFQENDMENQIQSMTGIKKITCNIAQMKNERDSNIIELIEFKNFNNNKKIDYPIYPGSSHVCFIVDNLSTMLEKIYSLGAIKLGEITRFESGLCVYCKEPAGSFFEMEELKK